jgi:hypothetical protein
MKKQLCLVLASLCLVSCQGAGSSTNSSASPISSASSSSPSSTSASSIDPLSQAVSSLKAGFDATAYIRESYYSSYGRVVSNGQAERVVLDSTKKEAVVKTLTYNAATGAKDNDSIPRYYHSDDKGYLQERLLNEKNEVYDNSITTGGIRYETRFYNPFEMLDAEDVTDNKDNTYTLKEGFAREVASWFGYSFSAIEDRTLKKALLTRDGDAFTTFSLVYDSVTTPSLAKLVGEFQISFAATGSALSLPELAPLSDDGTDKTALSAAFQKLGNNFTCTFLLKSGSMNLITSQKWKIYFDSNSVYYDADLYNTASGLTTGDLYMTKSTATDSVLTVYDYDSPSAIFKKTTSTTTYDDEKPSYGAISTNFFSKTSTDYTCKKGYEPSVFAALEPPRARYYAYTLAADSCVVGVDSSGLPSVKETFLNNSMGFGEEETVTVSYSDVGTTSIPTAVTSATLGQ